MFQITFGIIVSGRTEEAKQPTSNPSNFLPLFFFFFLTFELSYISI